MYSIIETADYRFRAEVDNSFKVCLHMDVYHWTPRVAKELILAYKTAREAFYLEGFDTLYTATQKPKFVRLVAPTSKFIREENTSIGSVSLFIDKLGEDYGGSSYSGTSSKCCRNSRKY